MRLPKSSLRHGALLFVSILAFPFSRAVAQTANFPARITQALDEKNLVTLQGNVHPLARSEFDRGVLPDGRPIGRMLLLLRRGTEQEASLTHLLDDQQNKSSRSYHAWLTPEEFGKQFGVADADIQAVTAWLTSRGFTGIKVGPGRQVIEFSGTAGDVRSAFRTEIRRFVVDGKEYTANAGDPQIPAALAPVVAGVVSLHNFPRKSHAKFLGQFRRTAGKTGLEPLFTFPNPFSGMNFYALGPGDFDTIYNSKPLIAAGNDGTGQSIAIVGETNLKVQDVQQFRKMFGLPANFDSTNVVLNGEDPGITSVGEEGEADLDVEWSGAVAPGATVKFVVSASTPASAGIDLSALYIVEHNLAGVMSESYGDCERDLGSAGNAFYNSLWAQAAAQGITVVISSGDGGSAGCDNFNRPQPATQGLAVSGLASTPFNVSVGGTDFDQVNNWTAYWNPTNDPTGTSAKSYIPEIPWSENCAQIGLTGCGATAPSGSVNIVAGSGGASGLYGKPKWQMGVVGVPNDNLRDQPDVSLFASPGFDGTGYVYCQGDQTLSGAATCDLNAGVLDFGIIGGTSASAPAFAGIMALVNQYQAAHGGSNRQGNANYVLYALAKKAGASCTSSATEAAGCVFNDVTKGNSFLPTGAPGVGTNSVPCQGGSPNCSVNPVGSTGVLVDPSHTEVEAWTATAGYDMTTGLGTVNVNNLATNWGSVSTIPTTTSLTLSPTTGITHGAGENVTVGVTVKANTGTGVPAGDVSLIATFPDGTTQGFDHFTLSSGAISGANTQSLPGGAYNVVAHYAGDGTNAPSDSSPVSVTVSQEGSQTFIVVPAFGMPINGNASSLVYGSSYIIRMYVTNSGAAPNPSGPPSPLCASVNQMTCPTGTVTLTDNGTPVDQGTFQLNNAGYTRDLHPFLTGGTHPLVAQYSGDSSYVKSTSATDTITITPAQTTTDFTSSNFYTIVGQSIGLSANAATSVPGGAAPTGTFNFFDGNTPIAGTVTTTSSQGNIPGYSPYISGGIGAIFSALGKHSITATYTGDVNYAPSTTASPIQVTAQYLETPSISVDSSSVLYGAPVKVTATVVTNHTSPPLAGTISFYSPFTATSGPVTTALTTDGSGNQVMTASYSTTPQSTEYITATYGGDPNYTDGSSTVWISVNIPDFSLSVPSAPFTITAGQSGTLQISVVPASNNASPVTLSCGGNLPIRYSCSVQPATVNLANGATSTATLTVSPSPSGTVVTGKATSFRHASILTIGTNSLWPLSLVSGLATLLVLGWPGRRKRLRAALGLGTVFAISVMLGCGGGTSFSGGGGGGGGTTPQATSTTVTSDSGKVAAGGSLTLTAKVTGVNKPTGSVTFSNGNQWLGTANLGTDGTAPLTTTLPFPGTYGITAVYSGDALNLTSTSSSIQELVTGSTVMQLSAQTSALFHAVNVTVTLQ